MCLFSAALLPCILLLPLLATAAPQKASTKLFTVTDSCARIPTKNVDAYIVDARYMVYSADLTLNSLDTGKVRYGKGTGPIKKTVNRIHGLFGTQSYELYSLDKEGAEAPIKHNDLTTIQKLRSGAKLMADALTPDAEEQDPFLSPTTAILGCSFEEVQPDGKSCTTNAYIATTDASNFNPQLKEGTSTQDAYGFDVMLYYPLPDNLEGTMVNRKLISNSPDEVL